MSSSSYNPPDELGQMGQMGQVVEVAQRIARPISTIQADKMGHMGQNIAHDLDRLAVRVERLTISRHRPEAFFEDRSEIADALRTAAREVRRA